jgi:hypothetical protein
MDPTKSYHAVTGFTIVSVRVKCDHCWQELDSSESWSHKQEHAIERSREKNRIPRRRFPR